MNYPTAAEMRKISNNATGINGKYLRKETDEVMRLIEIEANEGFDKLTVGSDYCNKVIVARLISLGYNANIISEEMSGIDYLSINW